MMRLRHILIGLAALFVCALAAPAAYADYHAVIRECNETGALTPGKYSRNDLKGARSHLPTDLREYTDCEDLINRELARLNRGGGSGGGGAGGGGRGGTGGIGAGGGGGTPPSNPALTTSSGAVASNPQDLGALNKETDPKTRPSAPPKVSVAGRALSPATGALASSVRHTEANDVPLPLILSLAGLAVLAALASAYVMRQRWPHTRLAALRLFRR